MLRDDQPQKRCSCLHRRVEDASVWFCQVKCGCRIFVDFKVAQLGIVVRDSWGEVFWTAVKKDAQVYFPFQAELKAILFGMEEMVGFPFQNIEVESDSLLAIREVENTSQSSCEWEGISVEKVCPCLSDV